MRLLSISVAGHEIAKSPVRGTMILIGRSPSCDIVLRAKGVRPVHFLMEWTATGDKPEDGFWSIFDVSQTGPGAKNEKAISSIGVGEGVVLEEKPAQLGPFEFRWVTDHLEQTALEGGAMSGAFKRQTEKPAARGLSYQLEIVSARTDSGSVTQVYHLHPAPIRNTPLVLPGLPNLKLIWHSNQDGLPLVLDFTEMSNVEIFKKGIPFSSDPQNGARKTQLSPGDLIQIHFQLKDHYFRLVPKIPIEPVRASFWKDPFIALLALCIVISAAVIGSFLLFSEPPVEEPPKEPPRIAQIEVKEVKPPPPVPEDMSETKPVVEDLKKQEPKKEDAPSVTTPTAKSEPTKDEGKVSDTKFKAREKKKAVGLNSPAPQADVNTVGLLGALKKKNPAVVKADMVLNDGVIAETATAKDGQFVVQQSPSGVVRKRAKSSSSDGLTAAYTTMSGGDDMTDANAGPIGTPNGKSGYNVGYKKADKASSAESGFSAEGGLDKESVRRALAVYRKDFRSCYERALLSKPRIKGRIVYRWQISGKGPVNWIKLISSTVDSPSLPTCVQNLIQRIQFPEAPNGQPTLVIYPFEFLPKD